MTHALTPAQQKVVAHNTGPALVFAVAGAGKTTAMVARIRRLVQDGIFRPHQILATAFNRDAADAIASRLQRQEISGVRCVTLHGLGYGIVADGLKQGLLPGFALPQGGQLDGHNRRLLHAALDTARRRWPDKRQQLNRLDQDEFLTFVARCKGSLAYADLAQAALPPTASKIASQAQSPDEDELFLPLFRLFEETRQQQGQITFDDMIATAWELLVTQPDLLARVQGRYRCLLVDEYQDVSRAQAELVALISQPHQNLMVIGDDDQTVYQWRGAQPDYILGFAARHNAAVYFLEENFRSRASHIALANAVIRHNSPRSPKQLRLTRGFDGETALHPTENSETEALALLEQVRRARRDGYQTGDVAILVRLYAQTAPIEAALLAAGIPYRVDGEQPFYKRQELRVLVEYLRLGQWEAHLLAGQRLNASEQDGWQRAWRTVRNRPSRWLTRALGEEIGQAVLQKGQPLSVALPQAQAKASQRLGQTLEKLAADIRWLGQQCAPARAANRPAHRLLADLDARLGYSAELLAHSGGESLGAAKAGAVSAFVLFAQGKGPVDRFLRHYDALVAEKPHLPQRRDSVTITTIFRAKGLEWPVVLLPGCVDGVLPYERGESLREERRLLYVALTRAQERLHLFAAKDRRLSRFLAEADAQAVLAQVADIRHALALEPTRWGRAQAGAVADVGPGADAGDRLGFYSFYARWWPHGEEARQQMARAVLAHQRLRGQARRFWQALAQGERPILPSAPAEPAPRQSKPRQPHPRPPAPPAQPTRPARRPGPRASRPAPRPRHFPRVRARLRGWRASFQRFFVSARRLLDAGRAK